MRVCLLVCGPWRFSLKALEFSRSHVDVFQKYLLVPVFFHSQGQFTWAVQVLCRQNVTWVVFNATWIDTGGMYYQWKLCCWESTFTHLSYHFPSMDAGFRFLSLAKRKRALSKSFHPFAANLFWGIKAGLACIFWRLLCWHHNCSRSRDQHYILYFIFLARWQTL